MFFKSFLIPAIVFLTTSLLMLAYGGFSWDIFLVDDNVCQWYPIIEKAYEQFFSTGHMPSYDFFQTKGLPIAYVGYYSLFNPLMMLSYALSHFCFIPFNTVAIYICLLCGFGNVVVYELCRARDLKPLNIAICLFAYSSSACFIAYHNWYYIFNNYLIVPLLVYSVMMVDNRKWRLLCSGAVLAFSIYLGNIQYTCYHYICYFVLMFGMFCLSNSRVKCVKTFVSNVIVGIVLSLPVILMALQASSSFDGSWTFLSGSVEPEEFLVTSFFPFLPILDFLPSLSPRPFDLHLEYSAAVLFPFLIGCGFLFYRLLVEKQLENEKYKKVLVILLSCLFWMEFMSEGLISGTLFLTPVINRFRFLFKVYFLLIPLLGIFLIFIIPFLTKRVKTITLVLVLIFSFLGLINNFVVYNDTRSRFMANGQHYAKSLAVSERQEKNREYGVDGLNYRISSFYPTGLITKDKFSFDKALNRNYPTLLETFSLSAYELASPQSHLKQFDKIYSTSAGMTCYGNNGINGYLVQMLDKNLLQLEQQIKDNSVRYFLIQEGSVYWTKLISEKMKQFGSAHVESVKNWGDKFSLITLAGVPSLCRFNDSTNISLSADYMDLLSFKANESGKYTLSFSFEDKLVAYALNDDGKKEMIEVRESPNGNIVIYGKKGQRIFITYRDPLAVVAQILEIITTILFVFAIVTMFSSRKENLAC